MMSDSGDWKSLDGFIVWMGTDDYDPVEKAHLTRHPRHENYIPGNEVRPLTEAEGEAYDALNRNLHEKLRRVSKEHFADTPVPEELRSRDGRDPWFTPFTYQNYDWYGPAYECYICVIGRYLSANLLKQFQSLLVDDYKDWCIQVVVSESFSFDCDHEIAVFSDQIIMHIDTATAFGIPPGR